ncbi:MAG: HAMP domain-containing histidine kinase, partial [Ignavibacteriales bacterium]|nr:HAMP domain-containing histidine kinase [Ignavibacteriales bacterium]
MRPFLKSGSPQSGTFKVGLLLFAFLIVAGTLFYTHGIVQRLEDRQKQVADLYAKSLEYLANAPGSMSGDYSFVFDEILRSIDFPIILTDSHHEPIPPLTGSYANAVRNIDLDTTLDLDSQRDVLLELISEMDQRNTPIKVAYQDTLILNYVHYGESDLVTQLRWFPYVEIALAGLFVLIAYMTFSYIKRSEQSNIWVGMARETAHQLGTPISSMLGWVELLKTSIREDARLKTIISDMEGDTRRLQKITDRFSKIGSKPDLSEERLTEVIDRVIAYFERRIPQTGKRVTLTFTPQTDLTVRINRELFEWVLENLIKNALDAIENGGAIRITAGKTGSSVFIDVSDTGKGVEGMYRKDIFRPGFSTKARGWGLGLSLSRRIVETYHKGKLMLKE